MNMPNVRKFLKLIKVYDCEFTKIRIGNGNERGCIVLDEICKKVPAVYTFGSGEDIQFEKDFRERYPRAKMRLYSSSLDKLPEKFCGLSLHKYGIGNRYKALTGIIQNSLLKMDIEGEEWSLLPTFESAELKKFSQIICEFHIIDVPPRFDLPLYYSQMYNEYYERINEDLFVTYVQVLEFIFNWFKIVHIHASNSLPVIHVDGYLFPPLLEVTFVRDNLARNLKLTKQNFPIAGLDIPSKTNRPDIYDYYPLT